MKLSSQCATLPNLLALYPLSPSSSRPPTHNRLVQHFSSSRPPAHNRLVRYFSSSRPPTHNRLVQYYEFWTRALEAGRHYLTFGAPSAQEQCQRVAQQV